MTTPTSQSTWPLSLRIPVAIAIVAYLFLLVLPPLTIPEGAMELTTPAAEATSPFHDALFLRHGYRFFGPDPGPTHALVYEITNQDGSTAKGHFPDRENTSPRLLYHRWFMVSETLFRECSQLPTDQEFQDSVQQYNNRIDLLHQQGKTNLVKRYETERDQNIAMVTNGRKRRDALLKATASVLRKKHEAEGESKLASIRFWIQVRDQPIPEESLDGMKLSDPVLATLVEVGNLSADDLVAKTSTESLPLEPAAVTGGENE